MYSRNNLLASHVVYYCSSDVDDTRAVLKESTQLLKQHNDPQSVPKTTKSSVLRVTVETCFRFTGFYNFGKSGL